MNSKKLAILILDDDSDSLLLAQKYLELSPYHVVTTSTIDEAHNLLEAMSFDIIFFDVNLHHENGIDFAKEEISHNGKATLVCLSSYAEMLDDELNSTGIRYVLQKPYNKNELMTLLNSIHEEREVLGLKSS